MVIRSCSAVTVTLHTQGSERRTNAERLLKEHERKAGRNYSSLQKEVLGIIFGVIKFHECLFRKNFSLFTVLQTFGGGCLWEQLRLGAGL